MKTLNSKPTLNLLSLLCFVGLSAGLTAGCGKKTDPAAEAELAQAEEEMEEPDENEVSNLDPTQLDIPQEALGLSFWGMGSQARQIGDREAVLIDKVKKQISQISEHHLRRALSFMNTNPTLVKNKQYVSLIDFSQPSNQKRLYVINTETGLVERYFVAHGKNSGETYARKFSNKVGSLMSSLGIYITGKTYDGKAGRSLLLHGMESTNSNALKRSVVMHGSQYVNERFARSAGRVGRSWGCPAVDRKVAPGLIQHLKGGSIIVAYN